MAVTLVCAKKIDNVRKKVEEDPYNPFVYDRKS